MLRSVHLTNYYHKGSGGIATSYNSLMAAAETFERRVCLIVPGERSTYEDVNRFARIYYVKARQSPALDKNYRLILPWQYLIKPNLIREIMVDEKPDIVEVADKYALSIMGAMIRMDYFQKLGRPMLVHLSCERMDDNVAAYLSDSSIARAISQAYIRNYILPSFDFHVANSEYTAAELHEAAYSEPTWFTKQCWRFFKSNPLPLNARIHVCPKGVDVERFSATRRTKPARAEIARNAGVAPDATLLLYAGRISPEKNIGLLVRVMENLKDDPRDFRLLVLGDGPQSEWLREQSKKNLGNRIVLLGHSDKERLADHYANADIFIHPNPREPFGIGPLEAMASGLPTVVPNSGGVLSYANNGNSWLTEPTGTAFAAAVSNVCDHPGLAAERIREGLHTARRNSHRLSTARIFETYDRMFSIFQHLTELPTTRHLALACGDR